MNLKSWFRKGDTGMTEQVVSAQSDVATIHTKLATCEQDIQAAEAELRAVSLQAALSEDPDAGHDTIARLNQPRGKRELLVNALAAAEQAEAEKQTALRHRTWQAVKRSLSQKTGQLERDAAEVERLVKATHQARERMADTGQGIVALLPASLRTGARPWPDLLHTHTLRELALLEAWRLDQNAPKPHLTLANYWPNFQDVRTGRITPITELVGQLCASLKSAFDGTGPGLPGTTATPPAPAAADSADVLAEQELAAAFGGSGSEQDQSDQV